MGVTAPWPPPAANVVPAAPAAQSSKDKAPLAAPAQEPVLAHGLDLLNG